MKSNIIKIYTFLTICFLGTSCLEGDEMNTPPDASNAFLLMSNNTSGGTLMLSGLRFFDKQALLLNPAEETATIKFAVTLQGKTSLDRDIHVTLATPASALDDFYYGDGIQYEMLPSTGYKLLSTEGVIPAGKDYAEFTVDFHPSVIDLTKNYMLPITATNDANLEMSSNYGFVYYHIIGNPIAGLYTRQYIRYDNAEGTGIPRIDDISETAFAPSNGTTIKVNSGTDLIYVVSFTDTDGVLTDFKVEFDAESVADSGLTISDGPVVAEADPLTGRFVLKYNYINSAGAARNITDIFTKK
jgi:hypothetical protein